jgi:hypothetical protein
VVVGFAQGRHSNGSAQSAVILRSVISSYTAAALALTGSIIGHIFRRLLWQAGSGPLGGLYLRMEASRDGRAPV